ncbi:MAG TPA: HEAT repeat domain-containing protein [Pyrinomonadaceae bacterium]
MFNSCMRLLAFLFLVGIAAVHTCAQSTPPIDRNVVFKVTIANDQREFRMGETIPLQLSFGSTVKDHYEVNMAQYDRSGRMNYEQFNVSPSSGAVDPLSSQWGSMGGITNFKFLNTEPWTIKLNLNEWVRFTQPGEYRLIVTSNRVGVRDPSRPLGSSAVTARSNEIILKIVRADTAWQKRILRDAVAKLDAPAPLEAAQTEQYEITRRQAMETLRFLGTADAAREMVKRMRGENSDGLDYVCMLGLISSPERSAVRTALEAALADPDHPIDGTFLSTLTKVSSDTNATDPNWREVQQKVVEALLAALPAKRGKALSISLSTVVNQAWDLNAVPPQTTEKLVSQLVSLFDKLPLNEQNTLLSFRWQKIKSAALLPILKRYAQSYRDFPEMRAEPAYDLLQLSGNALRHWYELDPEGARSAVITEISRPRPRFDARVLGLLPDKTLHEVDFVLAENFVASHDFDGKANLASLIARYATDAILPQIIEKLDPKIGKWACNIQNPLLAYVLRVSPVSARPRIEKAIAARGDDFTACNHELFQIVSEIHNDPILEEIGIKSLDDPDPEVAMTAATMLGRFGSPAAESALLERYTSWSEQWAGRETELDGTLFRDLNDKVYQLGLGNNLLQTLATGTAWLSDRAKLQRLSQQTKVRRLRQQLDNYLKLWDDEPLTIILDPSPFGFHARVAQYEFQSLEALKEKLTQFPSGTTFALSVSRSESSDNQTAVELRTFLSSHGMSVAERAQ